MLPGRKISVVRESSGASVLRSIPAAGVLGRIFLWMAGPQEATESTDNTAITASTDGDRKRENILQVTTGLRKMEYNLSKSRLFASSTCFKEDQGRSTPVSKKRRIREVGLNGLGAGYMPIPKPCT